MRTTRFVLIVCLLLAPGCKKKSPAGPEEIPDYSGSWTGTYVVTSCSQSGFFASANFCNQVNSTTAHVKFTFTQTDRTVTGSFQLGSVPFPTLNGSIADDDSLTFTATGTEPTFPIEATWTLRQETAGTLTGQTHQVWKANGQSGEGVVDGRLDSAVR
jgi:hypothetical protein